MKIKELTPMMGNIELEAEVAEVGQVREFNKFGKAGRVSTVKLKDETGTVALSLWNEQIDQISQGDQIKVTNGYVKEYQGELQLTTGMRGTIEVVKKAEKKAEQETPKEEPMSVPKEKARDFSVEEENIED
jgi:replication factor A1